MGGSSIGSPYIEAMFSESNYGLPTWKMESIHLQPPSLTQRSDQHMVYGHAINFRKVLEPNITTKLIDLQIGHVTKQTNH